MARSTFFTVLTGAVPVPACTSWLASIDAAGVFPAAGSSVRTDAVADVAALDVWSSMSVAARTRCANELGRVAIDLDQCWVRRQGAPHSRHPHSWHQDGALRFDFLASGSAGAPLPMVTCWITLTPCGVEAPGLELVASSPARLLAPLELRDDAVDAAWPVEQRVRPAMEIGDAVLFTGGVLHRTHVTTAMTRPRTSIELRCFPADALPERLAGDRFVEVEAPAVA